MTSKLVIDSIALNKECPQCKSPPNHWCVVGKYNLGKWKKLVLKLHKKRTNPSLEKA